MLNKREFMEALKRALMEQMDESEARGHIQYYENYIEDELRNGKKEDDIIAALGNPRLLVKSLVNVSGTDSFYEFAQDKEDESSMNGKFDLSKLSTNIKAVVGLVTVVIIVLVVLSVVTKIAWAVLKLLVPIVLIAVIVSFVWKNFIDKK